MQKITISAQTIDTHYAVLNRIGGLGDQPQDGFSRAAYSDEETAAMQYIEQQAMQAGLTTRWDAIGNLCVETKQDHADWVECGSHVDTVSQGGNFDGLAGVVAGLVAIIACKDLKRAHGLRLRVWRGEESASFGITSIGAYAAFGQLSASHLEASYDGQSLAQAMLAQDAQPHTIQAGKASINQHELDHILAHIELHIEQGIVLEKEGVDIGIVSGIRASARFWVSLEGEFDHSGATPMGTKYRKDSHLALAYILVGLDQLLKEYQSKTPQLDLVQTIGHINNHAEHNAQKQATAQHAISKVSGYAYFSFEVRSCDDQLRQRYLEEAKAFIKKTAATFVVQANIQTISQSTGVPKLDAQLQQQSQHICDAFGYRHRSLASGAWHDAALVAQQQQSRLKNVPVAMIFIPCLKGKSHAPEEFSSSQQIAKGASVLATLMQQGHE
ncbi:MAG: hydantoinase/carbamoylase family amidase [Mariprofundaceae bacterium]|nr:hydantoinase/carbamoylase family amidase [Mariprofundaceae bacterium]